MWRWRWRSESAVDFALLIARSGTIRPWLGPGRPSRSARTRPWSRGRLRCCSGTIGPSGRRYGRSGWRSFVVEAEVAVGDIALGKTSCLTLNNKTIAKSASSGARTRVAEGEAMPNVVGRRDGSVGVAGGRAKQLTFVPPEVSVQRLDAAHAN